MQTGSTRTVWTVWGCAAAALLAGGSALAQSMQAGKGLGLQPGRTQVPIGCGASLLPCASEQAAFDARRPESLRWNVELAPVQLGPALRPGATGTRQGLSLSLVGRKPILGSGFAVYGRMGATHADGGASAAVAGDNGLSFGAGLSYDFSARLSATFGWDTYELRQPGSGREALRSTSLGLQYRY